MLWLKDGKIILADCPSCPCSSSGSSSSGGSSASQPCDCPTDLPIYYTLHVPAGSASGTDPVNWSASWNAQTILLKRGGGSSDCSWVNSDDPTTHVISHFVYSYTVDGLGSGEDAGSVYLGLEVPPSSPDCRWQLSLEITVISGSVGGFMHGPTPAGNYGIGRVE